MKPININIEILDTTENTVDKKTVVFPSKRSQIFSRRSSPPVITFYDLAQVNIGTVENPVWSDHPILYSPNYTIQYGGPGGDLNSQYYIFELFGAPEHQAYYDLLFQFPVEEWKTKYRKLDWYGPSEDPTGKMFYQSWMGYLLQMSEPYPPQPWLSTPPFVVYRPLLTTSANKDTEKVLRSTYLDTYGFAWTQRGMEMKSSSVINMTETSPYGWLSFFLSEYATTVPFQAGKITEVYDPDAPPATWGGSTIPIFTGPIDVYLLPQIQFWWAYTTDHTGWHGNRYFLGGQWEMVSRAMYPKMVELNWTDNATPTLPATDDPNNRKEDFIEYQKARFGRRASLMVMTSAETTSPKFGTEAPMDPSLFPVDFYTVMSRFEGSSPGDSTFPTMVHPTIAFQGGSTSGISPTQDQLLCVFKMSGKFYYVWWSFGGAGNTFFRGRNGMEYSYSLERY